MSIAGVIDLDALLVCAGRDVDFAPELRSDFVTLVTVKMSDVRAAMTTRECGPIVARAHVLHGLLLTIGAHDAAACADLFEIASLVAVPMKSELDELQHDIDVAIDEARRIRASRKTSAIKTMTQLAGTRAA